MFLGWLGARLGEASTWNGVAILLGGASAFLAAHGAPAAAVDIGAVAAGASALAGVIMKDKGAPK